MFPAIIREGNIRGPLRYIELVHLSNYGPKTVQIRYPDSDSSTKTCRRDLLKWAKKNNFEVKENGQ